MSNSHQGITDNYRFIIVIGIIAIDSHQGITDNYRFIIVIGIAIDLHFLFRVSARLVFSEDFLLISHYTHS